MAYPYAPPPAAPSPAAPSHQHYGQSYQQPSQRGGHNAGRGRGGPSHAGDRGGYHGSNAPAYGFGPQQPPYAQQPAAPYGAHPPPQAAYPPQQQWHPEQGQPHAAHQHPQAPLVPQNYHPNYAPQVYGQQQPPPQGQPQQPYPPQQQPYGVPPPPQYNQPYPAPPPQHGPPAQHWGGQPPQQQPHGQFSGGRGGRGGHSDRGGKPSGMMGPPIRMGFDHGNPQGHPAPVSNGYQPPAPYGAPQGPPAPYPPAPYQAYPPPAPYVPPQQAAHYDGQSGHNHNQNRHGRGGFQHNNNNFKNRSQFGGDKSRNRPRGGHVQSPPAHHQKPDASSAARKKKRKTNTLGLTPGDESDEDDENEEEKLAQLIGDDAPNPTDIGQWIEERRRNFPTKARIEAKKAEAKARTGDVKKEADDKTLQLQRQQQKAEKLRKQLEKVESSIKRKREQQDEGDEMRDGDASSSLSLSDDSDDGKPETQSTKLDLSNLPPPPRKADQTKHCKYYSTGGTCGKKGKCRFVHDNNMRAAALQEREMNGGRMTLQQRLLLNDKEQEDLTIVQTLKYLQDKGLFSKSGARPAPGSQPANTSSLPTASNGSLSPAPVKKQAPNGLPPIPPTVVAPSQTVKYNGWNLQGFGNTGVTSPEA